MTSLSQQFVTMADDKTVDQPWMIVHYAVFRIAPLTIAALVALAAADVFWNKHDAQIGGLGGGIAAVIAAVASFIWTASAILKQDRAGSQPPEPAAPAAVKTTTTTEVAADPRTTIATRAKSAKPTKRSRR